MHGEAQGLSPGQTLTAARAVCPALVPVDADPVADEAALARLATWCERYTPMAAPDPPDGLWLDITGCSAVFGSEAELAQDLAIRLERNAIPCRLAIAGTTGAAWALAHAGERPDHSCVRRGKDGPGRSAGYQSAARCRRGDGTAPAWPTHGEGSAAHSAGADHRPFRRLAGAAAGSGARGDRGSDRLAAPADRVA